MTTTTTRKKTTPKKVRDPRGVWTKELREMTHAIDTLAHRQHKIRARLFARTYDWIAWSLDHGAARNVQDGVRRLAATLKRRHPGVENWYYCGKLMQEYGLGPTHDARSIRMLMNRRQRLSKSEFLKIIGMVSDRVPFSKVRTALARSSSAKKWAVETRVTRLLKHGTTAQHVKLEAMALATLAKGHYGKAATVTVSIGGKEIIRTKS
jgi:hypothetical protein